MIFGLIIGGFILYFFLSYATNYASTEEFRIKDEIITSFVSTTQDVYNTNVPVSFTEFGESGLDFDLSIDTDYNPPVHFSGIRSAAGTTTLNIPLIMLPGDYVYIQRECVDMEWWSFCFLEALSDMAVIFVPVENDEDTKLLIEDIVNAMPATNQLHAPKVTFGFCDGSDVSHNTLCSGTVCERYNFGDQIKGIEASSKCTAELPDNYRLVTISDSCSSSYVSRGVCLRPPDEHGIGHAYIAGSTGETYIYKNTLDLIALITGNDESTIHGITGHNYYTYVNDMFSDFVATASEMMSNRANLLAGKPGINPECHYSGFSAKLDAISTFLSSNPSYYTDYTDTLEMVSLIEEARSSYVTLDNKGCEP